MSYSVRLYRHEVKAREQASADEDFFDDSANLVPFSATQAAELRKRLAQYGYTMERETAHGTEYGFAEDATISALLTADCLYFSSTGSGIFEIGMTASEFTDSGEFAKYDPQAGGWEEV